MDFVTVLMIVIAVAFAAVAYWRQDGSLQIGLKTAVRTLLNLIPLLVAVFVIIGLADVLIPRELIANWLGSDAGIKGIFIGTAIGIVTPPSVFAVFPMAAAFYRAGAGAGATVAFITSWSLLSAFRLPLEIGIVGLRPTLIRLGATALIPPLVGLLTDFVTRFDGS